MTLTSSMSIFRAHTLAVPATASFVHGALLASAAGVSLGAAISAGQTLASWRWHNEGAQVALIVWASLLQAYTVLTPAAALAFVAALLLLAATAFETLFVLSRRRFGRVWGKTLRELETEDGVYLSEAGSAPGSPRGVWLEAEVGSDKSDDGEEARALLDKGKAVAAEADEAASV
ncbi:hypothetical protein Q8F55_001706 [Vanrija albida]|uniref:Uncharacterized protein n=1 Tax=Vanrija albida TaxID=181172 RepID=A0ABR3Q7R4_9TREE